MSHTTDRVRPTQRLLLATSALLLTLALAPRSASPALAQTAIASEPALPGARVPFRLLVSGTTFLHLEPQDPEPDVQIEGDEIVLRFGGRSQGIATPAPMPYAFWVDFPDGLPANDGYPRQYTVHVDTFLDEEPEQVFRQASLPLTIEPGAEITTPVRLTESERATVVLEGMASCPRLDDTEVTEGEIRIRLEVQCLILPPEPSPFRFEVEIGPLAAGRYRVVAGSEHSTLGVASLEVLPDPPRLQGERFLVDVTFASQIASGRASLVQAPSDESALFWFFGEDNWELMLKVLDGCDLNGHFWVFGAATTDVAHDIVIEDTATGNLWTASNPAGRIAEAITDTRAFPCGDGGLATPTSTAEVSPDPPSFTTSFTTSFAIDPATGLDVQTGDVQAVETPLGDTALATVPNVPTDTRPLTLAVRGDYGCGGGNRLLDWQRTDDFIRIDVTGDPYCDITGENPFVHWVDLGLLDAGEYDVEVWVHPRSVDSEPVLDRRSTVRVARGVELSAPAVATSRDPVTVTVSGYAACPIFDEPRIEGHRVVIPYPVIFCIVPVGEFRTDIVLDPLPAGTVTVELRREPDGSLVDRAEIEVLRDPVELSGGAYRLDVTWTKTDGTSGRGRPVRRPSEDSALYWFFGPDNWELMVKVLDGCAVNGHRWVFAAASTDVQYTLTVEETATGDVWSRSHSGGTAAPAIADTSAFACD